MLSRALLRYNFRVLMFHNWWLLVIPLAVSQLTVFWTLATQPFAPTLPANAVELISPLLAAFLCAHLLSAEYRSGIGAVLASKPIDIGKVVFLRLVIAIGLVWVLGWLSLFAFFFGMAPYPLLPPGIAFMVSSLFLGLFALTFATLFRHPLAGFGIAAIYWALDLSIGSPMNPFLSLKSLAASIPISTVIVEQPLTDHWWIAKTLLLLAALALYRGQRRLLFTLGSPLTKRRKRSTLAWAGGVFALYIITGASAKVIYGYTHRGRLFPNDAAWFRRQFAPYSPLPVASLFGPNFQRYLGSIPNAWRVMQDGEGDTMGDTEQHRRDLGIVLDTAPNSIWASSSAELLARLRTRASTPTEEKTANYRVVADRYGSSPYTLFALQQIAHIYADAIPQDRKFEPKARAAYLALQTRFPGSVYSAEALRFLAESDRNRGDLPLATRYAQQWIEAAPVYEKFVAYLLLAEISQQGGKISDAKQAARQAVEAVKVFRNAVRTGSVPLSETRRLRVESEANDIETRAKSLL